MFLRPSDHWLFFGDSITDAGRKSPDRGWNPQGLGNGYPNVVAGLLGARMPEMRLKFTNTGIGGNRIYDLEARLSDDVLDHKPTIVSILIGINDTWRRYDSNTPSPIGQFTASYRRILDAILAGGARVILCEPFLLPVQEGQTTWREDLDPRIDAIRALARDYGTMYIPLDGMFAAAAVKAPMAFWLPDGVHPSHAGHCLIAQALIDAVTR